MSDQRTGLTHDEAYALLLDLAYGELEGDARRDVSRHAGECSTCAAELERLAATRAAVKRLDDGGGPALPREALVRAARRAAAAPRRRLARPALSFAAAAAVVALVAGVGLQVADLRERRSRDEVSYAPTAPDTAAPSPRAPPPDQATPPAPRSPPPARVIPAPVPRPERAAPTGRTAAPAEREAAAARTPEAAPGRLAAPERPGAGAARMAAPGPAAADAAPPAAALGGAQADRTGPRRSGGELAAQTYVVRCGEVSVIRTVLVASGGRVAKLTERRGDTVVEGWYDEAGRLRAFRRDGEVRDARAAPGLPASAPTPEALATECAW